MKVSVCECVSVCIEAHLLALGLLSEQLKAHMADDTQTLTHAPDGCRTPAAPPSLSQKKSPGADLFVRAL